MRTFVRLAPVWVAFVLFPAIAWAQQPQAQPQPTPAQQTPPDSGDQAAVVRALFEEGVGFSDRGAWAPAADRFRRALALRNMPVIAHNLGVALARMGRVVEASEVLRGVTRDPTASAQVRQAAQLELDQALPRMGRLTVVVEGEPEGAVVTLDGRPLQAALFDVARPIDPGRHVVRATRGDEEVAREEVTIAEGRSESITIDVGAADIGDLGGGARGRRRRSSGGGVLSQWWFWTVVGVVVVGAGTAAIVVGTSGGDDPFSGSFDPPALTFR